MTTKMMVYPTIGYCCENFTKNFFLVEFSHRCDILLGKILFRLTQYNVLHKKTLKFLRKTKTHENILMFDGCAFLCHTEYNLKL